MASSVFPFDKPNSANYDSVMSRKLRVEYPKRGQPITWMDPFYAHIVANIRQKSVTDEPQRQPPRPAARLPEMVFKQVLTKWKADAQSPPPHPRAN